MSEAKTYKVVVADDYRFSRMFLEAQVRENERCDLSASFSDADSAPRVAFDKTVSIALTKRDLDVLREMLLGLTNEEIAVRLGISANTVRTHVQNMLNKTGFKNRLELMVHAASLGIVVNGQHSTLLES